MISRRCRCRLDRRWRLQAGFDVWVKHENATAVGTFKLCGGLLHLDSLKRSVADFRGAISATGGDHGQSIGYAGQAMGVPVTIVAPEGNRLMEGFHVRLVVHGADFGVAREDTFRFAARDSLTFVPSFHADLVLGVASLDRVQAH